MKLTTGVLWDYLEGYISEENLYECIRTHKECSSVRQYPRNDGTFLQDSIYVVGYEKYHIMNHNSGKYEDNFFVFVSDGELEGFSREECRLNAVLIANADIHDVFSDITDMFVEVCAWADQINDALISDVSLDELVKLGQIYIPNPFIILDAGLNLLAFTDNIASSDESFQETVRQGHTPTRLIVAIMKKRGKKGKKIGNTNIYQDEEDRICPYPEISVPVKINKKVVAVLYVHCSIAPFSAGLKDMLDYFAGKLSQYLERNPLMGQKISEKNQEFEQFFSYLLTHPMTQEEIRVMASSLHYPVNALFRLFVIQSKEQEHTDYIYNRIIEMFPQEKCLQFDGEIVMMSAFYQKNSDEPEHREAVLKRLEKLMPELDFYVGESRAFDMLQEIQSAHTQACKAVEIGRKLLENTDSVNQFAWKAKLENHVFQYDNLYLHHLLQSSEKDLPLKNVCMPEILRMIEQDREKGTNNYQVLYTYLENDRVTVMVAELLHMHRNNVNYRIKRIDEMFHLNLADPEERLKIQMTFRALDLM